VTAKRQQLDSNSLTSAYPDAILESVEANRAADADRPSMAVAPKRLRRIAA